PLSATTTMSTPESALPASTDTTQNATAPSTGHTLIPKRVRQVKARSLIDFGDTREFMSIMLDAIVAHRHLYEDAGILHGDINPNTIVILEFDDAMPGASTDDARGRARAIGALVDYDGPLR
ncbi:hypothetical protein OH77DRAFT_1366657, partial [Trametes cingulata]